MNTRVSGPPTTTADFTYTVPTAAEKRSSYRRRMMIRNLEGWLFASPWIIGLLTFFLGPMLYSIYLSLTSYNIVQAPRYIGLANTTTVLMIRSRAWQNCA